jgi:uncharacterized protein YxeA
MKNVLRSVLVVLLLAGAAGLFAGCATTDPDNPVVNPWNPPAPWQGPFPSTINQGR